MFDSFVEASQYLLSVKFLCIKYTREVANNSRSLAEFFGARGVEAEDGLAMTFGCISHQASPISTGRHVSARAKLAAS